MGHGLVTSLGATTAALLLQPIEAWVDVNHDAHPDRTRAMRYALLVC